MLSLVPPASIAFFSASSQHRNKRSPHGRGHRRPTQMAFTRWAPHTGCLHPLHQARNVSRVMSTHADVLSGCIDGLRVTASMQLAPKSLSASRLSSRSFCYRPNVSCKSRLGIDCNRQSLHPAHAHRAKHGIVYSSSRACPRDVLFDS